MLSAYHACAVSDPTCTDADYSIVCKATCVYGAEGSMMKLRR